MKPPTPNARLRRVSHACGTLLLAGFAGSLPVHATSLDVEVSGARNAQGAVICGLFDRVDTFRKVGMQIAEARSAITGDKAHCRFRELAPGRYAVAAFHAENGETEPSYGLFGKPRQGVAFTNNPSITFGPPRFDEAAIDVGPDSTTVTIMLKY